MSERVVIFGATSAIATCVAREYASRGARLHLVARNAERLASLCDELGSCVAGSQVADLDETAAAEARVRAAVESLGGGVDIALIAHGVLGDQLASEASFAVAEASLRTNLLSPISLLIPLAQQMEAAGSGRLAVITSVAGERGRPRNFTYGTAKGAIATYLEGLRSRLWGSGVDVCDLRLGPVDTPMTIDHEKNALFGQPRPIARRIVRAIDARRGVTYLPSFWRAIMLVVRNLPEPIFQRFSFLAGR